jgi:hypothetical protein
LALREADSRMAAPLNNWAFGQLCARAKVPAHYLRTLPPAVAAGPLNYSMQHNHEDREAKVLLRQHDKEWGVKAVTSLSYGRIYDADVSGSIIANVDLDKWKVPSASYAKHDPKRATTLYASDRDMFVCLVNDSAPVELPGGDKLFRGFIVRNSEVGASIFELLLFYYDYICDNRLIWGGVEVERVSIRHTSGGPGRYIAEATPMLNRYVESKQAPVLDMVKKASAMVVGKTKQEVGAWVQGKGFTAGQAAKSWALVEEDPRRLNPMSLWGVVQGLTGAAHEVKWNDDRMDLERKAGALLKLAA